MECTADFFENFSIKSEKKRIPLSGSIEITRRCNFSCVHCYLGGMRIGNGELETSKWLHIIDEITDAGCLFLLFTGGEPLLRPDFPEIYRYARKQGMVVTVFTNGSLVDKKIIDLFSEFPPQGVEITLYGASPGVYKKITGKAENYKKVMAGIDALVSAGINTRLKTVLLTVNMAEFSVMEKIADNLGVKFRFDAAIFPRFDGDKTPVQFRVSPKDAVRTELLSQKRADEWKKYTIRMAGVTLSDSLYDCSAGLNTFHIDPQGILQPCIMVPHVRYNLTVGGFSKGWHDIIPEVRKIRLLDDFKCRNCTDRIYCGFCPGFFRLETGDETVISQYLCSIGRQMGRAVSGLIADGDNNG
ncbi:MAG: radical SAM protein [Deltaproteobacteria bacterium]|nr:radical SAM protein [Deltaproteobacteria bacterium]